MGSLALKRINAVQGAALVVQGAAVELALMVHFFPFNLADNTTSF
jgi:hypothetical protein